jgi:hypothetical protein
VNVTWFYLVAVECEEFLELSTANQRRGNYETAIGLWFCMGMKIVLSYQRKKGGVEDVCEQGAERNFGSRKDGMFL